jgi:hypothetical protein
MKLKYRDFLHQISKCLISIVFDSTYHHFYRNYVCVVLSECVFIKVRVM